MTWKREACAVAIAFLNCFASQSPTAQNPGAQNGPATATQKAQEKIRVQSNLVVLSVTVKDANDNLVSGLRQDDFRVYDDDVEQNILTFADEGLPLSLVILVDNDMKWKEGNAMTQSLQTIAASLSETDEAMVCRYDMLFYPGDKFTHVSGDLLGDLKSAQAAAKPSPQYIPQPMVTGTSSTSGPPVQAAPVYSSSRPSKAIDDALYSAADLLRDRPRDRRRVILIVSDGQNEPKLNHNTPKVVLEELLQQNISVYALAVGSEGHRKFSGLANYATQTGGDIFYAAKSAEMQNLYPRITEQARHDYIIAYAPAGNNTASSYHNLRVTIDDPSLIASTRSGYYTGPPEAPKN
jgi:Ca-activated chloride channel family protein